MNAVAPTISCIVPTLNAARTLEACLASIRAQDYDGALEIVLVDAGSTDATLEIAARYGVDQVVENPLRTGEAGKARGVQAARGEILAFVDSDNVLVGADWLTRMTEPFRDRSIVSSEALRWRYSRDDGYVDRYCALTGVNDPLSLFIGNYGRYSHLTGRWTGFDVEQFAENGYLRVRADPALLPTMGANGYLVRASALRAVLHGDYLFDIDSVGELARSGFDLVARVDVAVGHSFARGYGDYVRKTRRRARDYLFYRGQGLRTYPWSRYRRGVVRFVLATVSVVPTLAQAARGYARQRDPAWFFHPVACWTTLVIYASELGRSRLRREALSRARWRQ